VRSTTAAGWRAGLQAIATSTSGYIKRGTFDDGVPSEAGDGLHHSGTRFERDLPCNIYIPRHPGAGPGAQAGLRPDPPILRQHQATQFVARLPAVVLQRRDQKFSGIDQPSLVAARSSGVMDGAVSGTTRGMRGG